MKILPQQSIKGWYFYRRRQQISVCCHNTQRKQTVRNFEDYQSWKLGTASEGITSPRSWLLVSLKHDQILIPKRSKPKQPIRLVGKGSSSHLSWKHPVLFHHSPYTPHWEHGLWAHDCPTRDWKDRKILQCSSQSDKERWDVYLASLATHALGTAEPQQVREGTEREHRTFMLNHPLWPDSSRDHRN